MRHRAWELLLSNHRLPKSHPAKVDMTKWILSVSVFAFALLCTYLVCTSKKHKVHYMFSFAFMQCQDAYTMQHEKWYICSKFWFCLKGTLDFLPHHTLLNTPSMNCQSSTHFTNSSYDAGIINTSYLCISTNMRLGFALYVLGTYKGIFVFVCNVERKTKAGTDSKVVGL